MKPPLLLRMTTPAGPAFEIPYHDLGPRNQAPALVLVGGIHGNELNGIFVLARLAGLLRSIQEKRQKNHKLMARVLIIPAVNILGLHARTRTWPFDRTDINRMFPGYNAGETTQRIADALFRLTRRAKIRIDIHSSNLEFEELPQVRVYDPSRREQATARLLGLAAVVECPVNKVSGSTLLHAWKQVGGQNFVVQAGSAGDLQLAHSDRLFQSLVGFLKRLRLLKDASTPESRTPEAVHYFKLHHTASLISEKAGLYVPRAELGRWVEKGTLLGDIYDGFDGRVRSRVRAPVAGLLSGRRRQALLYQGDLLARIQAKQPIALGADTYLIGQGQ